jgi:hypothetical protein
MNDRAQLVKTALMIELAKSGKSLADFEDHLGGKLQKTAGGAADLAWWTTNIPNALKNTFNAYGASLAGVGMLAGTGLYAGHLANEDSTNQQLKKQRERDQYLEAAKSLQGKVEHPNTL